MAGLQAEQAEMTIAIESLLELPEGAVYTERKGRTRVTAKRSKDGIVVRAESDSVAQTVRKTESHRAQEMGEEQEQRMGKTHREERQEHKTVEPWKPPAWVWVVIVLLILNSRFKIQNWF